MEKIKTEKPSLISISVPILDESGFSSGVGFSYRHIPYGRIDNELSYNDEGKTECSNFQRLGYNVNQRTFGEIRQLFSYAYKKFEFPYKDNDGVYIGFEHCNKKSSDEELKSKKCNITILPNLEARLRDEDVFVMGSSMGHTHPLDLGLQEIYEFHENGAMVLQTPEKIDLAFLRKGRKILVPGKCDMTIYNLSINPLETYDFANPRQNESNKELQKQKGPIFCIYYNPIRQDMHFKFNSAYSGDVNPWDLDVSVHIPQIRIDELPDMVRDKELKEKFAGIGVNLVHYDDLKQLADSSELLENVIKSQSVLERFGIR